MAAQKGSAFLLKDNSTGSPVTLGGMRSTSMSINGETVDITTKDSATFDGTSGNDIGRVLGANMGIRSMSISKMVRRFASHILRCQTHYMIT